MGQVVQLKLPEDAGDGHALGLALRKIERQRKIIAELRADKRALIRLLNEPLDEIRPLRGELMRMQDEIRLERICACTPERSDFLRRR